MALVYDNLIFYDKFKNPRRGYYLHKYLYTNLEKYFKPSVKRGWDAISLITGIEGSGKSTLGMTVAHFCDPTFIGDSAIDRICFTFDQFMNAIDTAKPYQAIVLDEAVITLMSQDAATFLQKVLVKKFVTMRKKRLFVFLIIPSIFLLKMYIAVNRSRFLLHTYTPDGVNRGVFKFYTPPSFRLGSPMSVHSSIVFLSI